jgi:hypothetical protein
MTLVGLDLDATRARAVQGPSAGSAITLRLEGEDPELPLALSLEGRQPAVGRAGLALSRRLPDSACTDFLASLGTARTWASRRQRVDAARAVGLVFDALARAFGKTVGVAASVPPYLSADQTDLLVRLAERARWRLLATLPAPLAAALAAPVYLPWSGLALVLDADDHALTCSAVAVEHDRARLLATRAVPQLARGAWLGRLLDGIAHRCVRQNRRDPRESAEAEQSLYDQLLALLDDPPGDRPADLVLQTSQWYQRLALAPAEWTGFCAPLVRQAVAEATAFLQAAAGDGPAGAVLLTPAAGRLPGLPAALAEALGQKQAAPPPPPADEEDFGEGLLQDGPVTAGPVHVLGADALARAAHEVAVRVHRGDLPAGPLESVPLPAPATRAGPGPGTDTEVPPLRLRLPLAGGSAGPAPTVPLPRPAPRWRLRKQDD